MTTDHQPLWDQLASNFKQDFAVTQQLVDVLENERKALEERDYDTFKVLLADKQNLLLSLESNAQQRQQLLAQAGLQDESATLDLADRQAPAVASAWRKLADQWRRCQELNEINERIAKRTRLVVGQMLDMLRGTSGATKIYDSKGGTRSGGGGNTISNA